MSTQTQGFNRSMPKPMATISASMVQQGPNYSITIIKVVSIPNNVYLLIYITCEVKKKVFTRVTEIYIIVVKLITIPS